MVKFPVAKLQLVEILWTDSASTDGWKRESEMKTDSGVTPERSAGYLLNVTPKHITIVQSTHDLVRAKDLVNYVAHALSIPRFAIVGMRTLR